MFNHLIFLLIAIITLAANPAPTEPQVEPLAALFLFLGKTAGLLFLLRPGRAPNPTAADYFRAEQRGLILVTASFVLDVYLLELPWYLRGVPLADRLPSLGDALGLLFFFAYLALVWLRLAPLYNQAFSATLPGRKLAAHNLRLNLVFVLPWLLISLFADLLRFVPVEGFAQFLDSPWGEPTLILLFLLGLLIFFPSLVVRLWGCRPFPKGEARSRLEAFLAAHRIRYREILHWPILGGRLLTAGVMGLVPRHRYLLVTPALAACATEEELEAVMAHEIGHVRYFHLPLYLLFFLGFGLVVQMASYPLVLLVLNTELFAKVALATKASPVALLTHVSTGFLLVAMLLYFRYLFGFFMRNFERQADLFALKVMGSARPLVTILEKIAWLSGRIRDLPSWHHFGIGERVAFLEEAERSPRVGLRHHLKVYGFLCLYLALLAASLTFLAKVPADIAERPVKSRFLELVLREKIAEEADNPLWYRLLGDLQYSQGKHEEARKAYEAALGRASSDPELMNNLAWVLLTAPDPGQRDPKRALLLAEQAARQLQAPHVLDTLATAYWMNGRSEEAVRLAEKILEAEPPNREYYQKQLQRFRSGPPGETDDFPGVFPSE